MRIVGGRHRGRRLEAPGGMALRPTADRTREALFNILCQGKLDWRRSFDDMHRVFEPIEIPQELTRAILRLMGEMGLVFGMIGKKPEKNLAGLTWFSRHEKSSLTN